MYKRSLPWKWTLFFLPTTENQWYKTESFLMGGPGPYALYNAGWEGEGVDRPILVPLTGLSHDRFAANGLHHISFKHGREDCINELGNHDKPNHAQLGVANENRDPFIKGLALNGKGGPLRLPIFPSCAAAKCTSSRGRSGARTQLRPGRRSRSPPPKPAPRGVGEGGGG